MKIEEMLRLLEKNYAARHKLCSPVESWLSTGQKRGYHQHPHGTQNHPAKKKRKKGKKDTSQHQSVNIIVRVSVQKSYLEQRLHAAKEIKKQKNKAAKE